MTGFMHAIELNLGCEAKVASLHVYNNIANTLPAQFKIPISQNTRSLNLENCMKQLENLWRILLNFANQHGDIDLLIFMGSVS